MAATMNAVSRDTLEKLIDESGLVAIVSALSEICDEKVEHLEHAWQENERDSDQIKTWRRNANTLNRVAVGLWRQVWER